MSDLTPDGDPIRNGRVAIRYFPLGAAPRISAHEAGMLRDWAHRCQDPQNGETLLRLVNSLATKG